MNKMDNFKKSEGILYNYNILTAEIDILKIEIEEVANEYQECKSMAYGEKTGATNKINNVVADEVIHKEKIIRELTRLRDNKINLKNKIDRALNILTDTERKIVELRYLSTNKKSWYEVASIIGVSEKHCCTKMRTDIINKISPLIFLKDSRRII